MTTMPATDRTHAVIAAAQSLAVLGANAEVLRPIADYLIDQCDTECDLQLPEVW